MHYVIGDVHGCFEEMMCLLSHIDSLDPAAQYIFLGDMIDRGPMVYECLQWMLSHVTADGKYRMVIGNHEAAVVEWYHFKFLPWIEKKGRGPADYSACKGNPVPRSKFDFSDMITVHGLDHVEALEPIISFFENLPSLIEIDLPCPKEPVTDFKVSRPCSKEPVTDFKVSLPCPKESGTLLSGSENLKAYLRNPEITSESGEEHDFPEVIHYKIVHAWYMKGIANEKMQRHINIRRRCLNGNPDSSYIVIHGHTPTNSEEFLQQKREGDRPGRICYRENGVNLDGGCCFGTDHGYKGMLCAICLETMEEFYAAADDKSGRCFFEKNEFI